MPAPTGGWDALNPLASMPEDRAVTLDNWFPQPGYVEVRRGYKTHATGLGTGVVDTLMPYHGQTTAASRLFAVANAKIYEVTSEATASATSVSSLSSNRWQHVNFTTSAGTHYLWACSGADSPRTYDGSNWATPSLSGITAADVINVNVHKNRIWLCLANSMNAAYLNTDSISGTATKFNLGSVMGKGGFLVSMGTWTIDGGAGPDDFAVFVSSRGQVAVYQGTDPSSSTTWDLVGVYDVGAPIGFRCLEKVAGDLALVSIDGVLPLSRAIKFDRGAVAGVALTANINNAMNAAAVNYGANFGWRLIGYPRRAMAILNVPVTEGGTQHQYVMNTLTGAWCRFTGWNSNCWAVYRDNPYFGGNDGKVYRADFGAVDGTSTIVADGQCAYNYLKSKGRLKRMMAIQPLVTTSASTRPAIGIATDFKDNATLGTPTGATTSAALYDSALYDTGVYATDQQSVTDWTDAPAEGQAFSILFRANTNAAGDVLVRMNGFNATYELGEFL